jgi:tetratricopeptide (TPR) repeat protein
MRSLILGVLAFTLILPFTATGQHSDKSNRVFWDGGTIPDNRFREYVLINFDTDHNGTIDLAEADAVTEMRLNPLVINEDKTKPEITSLQGISYFQNLETLMLTSNEIKLTDLSYLSQNGKLKQLAIDNSELLTQLDLSVVPTLERFIYTGTKLKSLILDNPELKEAYLYNDDWKGEGHSGLTQLDFSARTTNLETLDISDNFITKIDLSHLVNLKKVSISCKNLSSLNLPASLKLTELAYWGKTKFPGNLADFPNLTRLSIRGVETPLDLSKNSKLKDLDCSYNGLTRLDVSVLPDLEKLVCDGNELVSLDLSRNPRLKELECSNNKLPELDVSGLSDLEKLKCKWNAITSLDLSQTTKLVELDCSNNKLTSLDISCCPAIKDVRLDFNNLTEFNFSHTKLENLNSRGAFKSSNLTFYNGNAIADYMIDCWVFTGAAEPKQIDGEANRNLLQSIRDYKRDIAAKEHVAAEEQRAKAHRMAAEYKRQIMPYITSNDWNEADKFAAEALSNLPEGDAFLYYVRAKAYYLNNLDFEVEDSENMTDYFKAYRREAEHLAELCRKSITCDPSDGNEAYFYRGLAYIVLGRANDAANDFMRCARGNESIKAVCYYNVGIAYKNAGRYNAALDQFKNARQYFSDADNKERCLRKIKECQQKISGK